MMSSVNTFLKNVFIILTALSLLFHVFNTLQVTESVKAFHLFAIGAVVIGFFITGKNSKTCKYLIAFMGWTLFSCLLSPVSVSFRSGIKFLIVLLSAFFITRVPINKLVKVINCVIPLILLGLLVKYYIERPFYRFQGFYDDPNYMCTTLLVALFFVFLMIRDSKSTLLRIGFAGEIVIISFLILRSISRTGLLCLAVMLVGFFWDTIKKNGKLSIVGLLVCIGLVFYFKPDIINDMFSGYIMRETENSDTIDSATGFRWEISMRGINYISYHPRFFMQGIGIGSYSYAYELSDWSAPTRHMDHNTFTSCFSEQGFVGLILYLLFLFYLTRGLLTNPYLKDPSLKRICIVSLSSLLLFSISINQMCYLPFWIALMTLTNISETVDEKLAV